MSASTAPTPPGFNKRNRDISKTFLAGTALCLISGRGIVLAILLSAASTLVIKQGTLASHKNWKWLLLSIISFVVSLVSAVFLGGEEFLDNERDRRLKFRLWFRGRLMETVWGGILGLVLASSFSSSIPRAASDSTLTSHPIKKAQ